LIPKALQAEGQYVSRAASLASNRLGNRQPGPPANILDNHVVAIGMKTAALLVAFATIMLVQVTQAQSPVADEVENPLKPERETFAGDTELVKLMVTVLDEDSGERLQNIQVQLINDDTDEVLTTVRSSAQGLAEFSVPLDGNYRVETCNKDYLGGSAMLTKCETDPFQLCVEGFDFVTYEDAIGSLRQDHIVKTQLKIDRLEVGKIVDLDKIYYDFDKATLRPKSNTELDQLVRALEMLPSLEIQLRSHTDSRGSDEYNQKLSQRRAESVVDYLVAAGISNSRFTAKGFGERRLVNECADGVACTEEQHQDNRRTEFEILAYEPRECE
jgi:outer membrane protein OmpA-like peptidoglycan-associated protein